MEANKKLVVSCDIDSELATTYHNSLAGGSSSECQTVAQR